MLCAIKASDNARILINYFPELESIHLIINHTPIHMAISSVDADVSKIAATPQLLEVIVLGIMAATQHFI